MLVNILSVMSSDKKYTTLCCSVWQWERKGLCMRILSLLLLTRLLVACLFTLRSEDCWMLDRLAILLLVHFRFCDIFCFFASSGIRLLTTELVAYIKDFATWQCDYSLLRFLSIWQRSRTLRISRLVRFAVVGVVNVSVLFVLYRNMRSRWLAKRFWVVLTAIKNINFHIYIYIESIYLYLIRIFKWRP